MNYNPYYFSPYLMSVPRTGGLFSNLFKGAGAIKWSGILSGTQKALNIANKAIPVIKQVSPMMKNVKTMFKVMNEFKKVDTPKNSVNKSVSNNTNEVVNDQKIENTNYDNGPQFFV